MCNGAACNQCGAGCWNNAAPYCEHDVTDRHGEPNYTTVTRTTSRNAKIAIYTSITASKDSVKTPWHRAGVDLVLFSDEAPVDRSWGVRHPCNLFTDPRRNSRAPKILAHQYLPGYDFSLWVDGSVRLLVPAHVLIDSFLGDSDIALFKHQCRDCIYDEATACMEQGLDHPDVISTQMVRYRAAQYPARNGLSECGVLLRRHTPSIEAFNNAWWAEYCRHSCRDQLSVDYVLRNHDIRPTFLPGSIVENPGIAILEAHR